MSPVILKSLRFRSVCLLIVLATIDLAASVVRSPLPPGYIHHSDINAAFKIHNSFVDWNSAKGECESEGGRLAVVDTQTKLNYVLAGIPHLSWAWVGIKRNPETNVWKSVDNSVMSSPLPWAPLNPKIIFGMSLGDCVTVGSILQVGSGLANWGCGKRKRFVCEIPDVTDRFDHEVQAPKNEIVQTPLQSADES